MKREIVEKGISVVRFHILVPLIVVAHLHMFSHLGESEPDEPSENGSSHGDVANTQRLKVQLI